MSYLSQYLALEAIHVPILLIPGAVFVMLTNNSLIYSRRIGMYCALGLILATTVHLTYTLGGLGLLIAGSRAAFEIIKFLGAAYLFYLGVMFVVRKVPENLSGLPSSDRSAGQATKMTVGQAMRSGFLVEILNPNVAIFFLAIFSQTIASGTPFYILSLYGLGVLASTFSYFAAVVYFFSSAPVRKNLYRFAPVIQKCLGIVILIFSLRLAFLHFGGG